MNEKRSCSSLAPGTIAISHSYRHSKFYNLPTDFLTEWVPVRLGSIIEGFNDDHVSKVLLTISHVVPTSVSSINQETLFFSVAEELIRTGDRTMMMMMNGLIDDDATYFIDRDNSKIAGPKFFHIENSNKHN